MVGKLVELRRFDGTVGAERLAELVFETVATTDPALAPVVHQAISELGANVPQHSGRESGFLAGQRYARAGNVCIAVGDAGAGVRAT